MVVVPDGLLLVMLASPSGPSITRGWKLDPSELLPPLPSLPLLSPLSPP
jgi:hypothetical protein